MTNSEQARHLRDSLRRVIVANGTLKTTRRPCGVVLPTTTAYVLLELLNHGPMTVSELAAKLSIDRTNVSRLCLRIEKTGEVIRKPHPKDGRAIQVELTTKGKTNARAVDAASTDYFEQLARDLGASTPSVINVLTLLERAITQTTEEE